MLILTGSFFIIKTYETIIKELFKNEYKSVFLYFIRFLDNMDSSYTEQENVDLSENAKRDGIEEVLFSYTEYSKEKNIDKGVIFFEKDEKKWLITVIIRNGKKTM